jgi:hypothetical protein
MPRNSGRGLNQNNVMEKSALSQQSIYSEIADIFPALHAYKEEHNIINLQKLCVEVSEFCRSIYASTQNENERKIYREMTKKLQ